MNCIIYIYTHTHTKILEVNLFAFAYRLFRRDFSPLDGTYCMGTHVPTYCFVEISPHSTGHIAWVLMSTHAICPVEWGEISTKQSVGKCKQINSMSTHAICPVEWGEISTKQSVGKCKQINF